MNNQELEGSVKTAMAEEDRGTGQEPVARTEGWWAVTQLRIVPEERKKCNHKPKRTVTIGDLRENLTLDMEADRALNILGLSVTDRMEPSDSSLKVQEHEWNTQVTAGIGTEKETVVAQNKCMVEWVNRN